LIVFSFKSYACPFTGGYGRFCAGNHRLAAPTAGGSLIECGKGRPTRFHRPSEVSLRPDESVEAGLLLEFHQSSSLVSSSTFHTEYFSPLLFLRGFSCPSCIQALLSLYCVKLTISGFPHNCLPVSCGDIGLLKKILGLVLDWKSGLKVLFLPLGRSCPLQTILLSDLVWCYSPLLL
jgi:hypothetical protein